MAAIPQYIAFDENGNPYILVKDQEKKTRLSGLEAQKVKRF